MDGCYVLAVACKELPADTTTEQIMAMQREDVESASTLEVNSARRVKAVVILTMCACPVSVSITAAIPE